MSRDRLKIREHVHNYIWNDILDTHGRSADRHPSPNFVAEGSLWPIIDSIMRDGYEGSRTDEAFNLYVMAAIMEKKGFKVEFHRGWSFYEEVLHISRELDFTVCPLGGTIHCGTRRWPVMGIDGGTMHEMADFLDLVCSKVPEIRKELRRECLKLGATIRVAEIAQGAADALVPDGMRAQVRILSEGKYEVSLRNRKRRRVCVSENELHKIGRVVQELVCGKGYGAPTV